MIIISSSRRTVHKTTLRVPLVSEKMTVPFRPSSGSVASKEMMNVSCAASSPTVPSSAEGLVNIVGELSFMSSKMILTCHVTLNKR